MGRIYSMAMTDASKEASLFHNQKPVILMPADRWLDHNRTGWRPADLIEANSRSIGRPILDARVSSFSFR
ncbi:hypothetical protein A3726_04765 [Erythrobacter sp. HI0037]|nr:hypothetical protein A3719_05695 [Erythrobacter sp. HI0020]KZY17913.1 hypothetical protein A3727_04820 [Erythrobacter sp. HI0038]KZY17931.1 hypothetical protein A3727_16980 [Erythrobacter sp. HI0038]KZY23281.1 hypothetical protein A3726_28175 [Erythrobacter sp. HI0037]KZY24395.1 hypothetical protein A3726_04765 [Erythrobacter sp. HI0037]